MTDRTIESAIAALQAGKLADAEKIARELLSRNPDQFDLLSIAGVCAMNSGRASDALVDLERATQVRPHVAAAHVNLAECYRRLNRPRETIAMFRRAVELEPASIDFLDRLAGALVDERDFTSAVEVFRRLVAIDRSPRSLDGLAFALRKSGQTREAVDVARQANGSELPIALVADHRDDEALRLLQNDQAKFRALLERAGRYSDLADAWEKNQRSPADFISWLTALFMAGRRERIESLTSNMIERFPDQPAMQSLAIATALYSPDATDESVAIQHRRWWKQFGESRFGAAPKIYSNDRNPDRIVRIGYISPFFREHPITFFMEPILRGHRRSAVSVFCYSDAQQVDSITARLRSLSVTWRDTSKLDDLAVEKMIRDDRIDILVDLNQHLAENRMSVFACKPAPIQFTYLGYPYGTGLESMDYRLSDPHLDPPDRQSGGPEDVVHLPESYFCYQPPENAPAIESTNLPSQRNGYVTFGSMNQFIKMNDQVLDAWAKILSSLPNSRLFAKAHALEDAVVRREFTEQFVKRGIAVDRIELAGLSPLYIALREFAERADVMLDPFPYPGGTTTCHLLYMGLPVVTLAGAMPTHRMGVTLLRNLGLDDLIAENAEDFVRIAVAIAKDDSRRQQLRSTLRDTMQHSPLMDVERFVSALEIIYRDIWRKWCGQSSSA